MTNFIYLFFIYFFSMQYVYSQNANIGFTNIIVQSMVDDYCSSKNCQLISIAYLEYIDNGSKINCSDLFSKVRPYILKTKKSCFHTPSLYQDGEIIGMINNKIEFVIRRKLETNKYEIIKIENITDIENHILISSLLVDRNLNQAYKIFNIDMNKIFIYDENKVKTLRIGIDSEFIDCNE